MVHGVRSSISKMKNNQDFLDSKEMALSSLRSWVNLSPFLLVKKRKSSLSVFYKDRLSATPFR